MDRNERKRKIIEIVKNNAIETQEELVAILQTMGYNVTQATVSRDIKELKLVKINTDGHYRYAVATEGSAMTDGKSSMLSLYREAVERITVSLNLIVVRTKAGNAGSVAAMLDSLNLPKVIGSIGGDDTVLLIAESVSAAPEIAEKLREYF